MAWGKNKNKKVPQYGVVDEVQDDAAVDAVEADGASSGFAAKFKAFQTRFKFDSHHAMERFGVAVAVFSLTGAALLTGAGVSSYTNSQEQLSATAMYTQSFTTSRTQATGRVMGVYTDPSKTRTMVLLNARDGARLPANADDYQVFLTGTDRELHQHTLKGKPITARYVTFGNNAKYMGVVLDNPNGFDLQILDMTIRINREISYKEGEGAASTPQSGESSSKTDPNAGDKSFQQYDQMRIAFNPVASGSIMMNLGTAGTEFNAGDVYHEAVTRDAEQKLRDEMDGQLLQMKADLAKIDQYTSQIATTSVNDRGTMLQLNEPVVPDVIAGDEVTGQDAKSSKTGESTLFLSSKTVVPGGYDFDWRHGTVNEGYLDQVVPKGMSYVDFMKSQAALSTSSPDWQKVEFTLNNGTPLSSYTNRDTFIKPLLDLRSNLITSWQTYYDHKKAYQVTSYNDLLNLEIELRNVRTNTVQNTNANVLTLY
mgnify:CR=1 FL=1|jgi:hypothetical protein